MWTRWEPGGDQVGTRWGPCRDHVGPTWGPGGDHVGTVGTRWGPRGDQVGTRWGPGGDHVGTTWGPRGDHVGTRWGPRGDQVGTRRGPGGDQAGTRWGPGDKVGTRWGPGGDQVGTRWGPRGDHVGWGPGGGQVGTRRGPGGNQEGTTCGPGGNQAGTRWEPGGNQVGTTWEPGGDQAGTRWGAGSIPTCSPGCVIEACGAATVSPRVLLIRFIREYDTDDRDPSASARSLRRLRETMNVLFLQGYILCDPQGSPLDVDVAAPALASRQGTMQRSKLGPKTITQIAMEQCNDMMKVDVCGKTMMLWGKTSREDALAAMSEMKGVVRDMIGRLDVDFCENSLYLCLECFDLESWQAERQSATGRERLHRKSRLLCEVFRVVWTPSLWSLAVEVAMKQRRLFGDSQKPLHANRAAWAMALAESLAFAPPQDVIVCELPAGVDGAACVAVVGFQTVISFYLSFRDGTPDVERLFARLKEIGHEHGDLQYAEACLELIKEGPQREDEMFEQRPSGPLLMTPFTRRCAELWQARWGKRFTVQKTRLDVGKRRIGDKRARGMTAVDKGHAVATKRLLSIAADDQQQETAKRRRKTILGIRRTYFEAHEAPPANGKSIQKFRAWTKTQGEARRQFRIWTGSSNTPIVLRSSTGTKSVAAPPQEPGSVRIESFFARKKTRKTTTKPPTLASWLLRSRGASSTGLCSKAGLACSSTSPAQAATTAHAATKVKKTQEQKLRHSPTPKTPHVGVSMQKKKPKILLKISSTSKAAAAAAARTKKSHTAAEIRQILANSISLADLGREAYARTTKSIKMASASTQGTHIPVASLRQPRWGRLLSAR